MGTSRLPNGTMPGRRAQKATDPAERIRQLEEVLADVYETAVAFGFPQPLLNRLWMVGAGGNAPRTFDCHEFEAVATPEHPPLVPDVRLIDRGIRSGPLRSALAALPTRRRVMVVDDDEPLLRLAVRILSSENYEILSADSGPAALATLATSEPIDLLITDYVMPSMNGRELATQVRQQWGGVKVLYETGFTDYLFEKQRELEAGAAFIEKPFSARGLIEAARLALFDTFDPTSTAAPGTTA